VQRRDLICLARDPNRKFDPLLALRRQQPCRQFRTPVEGRRIRI
jgi:hypothetical protein